MTWRDSSGGAPDLASESGSYKLFICYSNDLDVLQIIVFLITIYAYMPYLPCTVNNKVVGSGIWPFTTRTNFLGEESAV